MGSDYALQYALHWIFRPEADKVVPLPVGLIRRPWQAPDGSTQVDHAAFAKFGQDGESILASFYTPVQTEPIVEGVPSSFTFHLERLQDCSFGEGDNKKKFDGLLTCRDGP
mgnify:FL=1